MESAFACIIRLLASNVIATAVTLFMIGCGALQVRLMEVAGKAQMLAAALNHSAFNIANAIGASLGGLSIAHGYVWTSTGWVASLLAICGICLMAISVLYNKKLTPKALPVTESVSTT